MEMRMTAREAFLEELAQNPKCKLAPEAGEAVAIGGGRPTLGDLIQLWHHSATILF
jgi:hypothetical protein